MSKAEKQFDIRPEQNNLFKGFTDDQLYILKRQAIHSSCDMMTGGYTHEQKEMHSFLLNAILNEFKHRAIYHDEKEALLDYFQKGVKK